MTNVYMSSYTNPEINRSNKPIFYKKPLLKPAAFFALATLATISLAGVVLLCI
jgi:hypothetical protein